LAGDAVPVFLQNRISPHQLGLSDILATLTIAGKQPPNLVLIGMVPRTIELGLELSPEIEAQVDMLVERVVRELADIGVVLQARGEVG
jgi:hydrogenase maturation protease